MALEGAAYRRAGQPDKAQHAFDDLAAAANARIACYPDDFAAWLFRRISLCIQALDNESESLKNALDAFRRARQHPVEPAPTFLRQILFLIETAAGDTTRHQLQPVTHDLEQTPTKQTTPPSI